MIVLDSSVVLAMIWAEPGGERTAQALPTAQISTVNLAEVATRLVECQARAEELDRLARLLGPRSVPFSAEMAIEAGALRKSTRHLGLSLGDRCCLALAARLGAPVLTADRAWADLDLGVEIEVVR
ncbi:PIN domain-containing protein [Rhodobacteraceae bacterium CCMM004]|nr:PIN domain-containing protein [Rhodobacteraceae bacterium CCMM004]